MLDMVLEEWYAHTVRMVCRSKTYSDLDVCWYANFFDEKSLKNREMLEMTGKKGEFSIRKFSAKKLEYRHTSRSEADLSRNTVLRYAHTA